MFSLIFALNLFNLNYNCRVDLVSFYFNQNSLTIRDSPWSQNILLRETGSTLQYCKMSPSVGVNMVQTFFIGALGACPSPTTGDGVINDTEFWSFVGVSDASIPKL